jgi:hypothetical protein
LTTIPTAVIPTATAAVAATTSAQPCIYTAATAGYHQATTAFSCQQLFMLQLQEDGSLCSRMSSAQAKQFATSSSTRGQSVEGPSEGPPPRVARANYTTVEDIPTGEEVLAGMFSLNEHHVIILFDSGASHDFISSTCAKKTMLSMVVTEAPYVISTPGARVDADRIVCKAPLELARRVFSIDLIILRGQSIDVILGMSWMKRHKAVLDIAGRLIRLDSPVYGKITLQLSTISRIKASLYHVAKLKLEDIHVVQEFLDVFLDDLAGMPPEREIEFKIELQPGTAPIAKALYKMSPVELKELKIQL